MNKAEIILNKINSEEEYISKSLIYDLLIDFINEKDNLLLKINKLLIEHLLINKDKLKYYLIDNLILKQHLEDKKLNDKETFLLLNALIEYEKRYL